MSGKGVTRPGSLKGVGGGQAPSINKMAKPGSGEFVNFHPAWSGVQCNTCKEMGHLSAVCHMRTDRGRKPFDRHYLAHRGLPEVEELGVAMIVTTQTLVKGMEEVSEEEFGRLLLAGERELAGVEPGGYTGMLARDSEEVAGDESWLAGVPRCVPTGDTAIIDSGCSLPMVNKGLVDRLRARGTPMEFLKCTSVRRIETGKGVIGLVGAVRFLVRMPIWDEDAHGKPRRVGHMPIPVVAMVNPLLPVDFLWGNTLALEYSAVWTPWNGRYWLDCPMRRQRVFIQLAYTLHLSVVAPIITYDSSEEAQATLAREWMGCGPSDHVYSFPLFAKARWSDLAYRVRYDRSRVPNMCGSYPKQAGETERRDPYAFRADGTSEGLFVTPPKHRQAAREARCHQSRKGLTLANAFASLAETSAASEGVE